jgi:ADP-heptose:LPS heptosyltransferase
MRCGAFGDIVLLKALIRQLHARFGQPVDVIASGPWTLPLLQDQVGVGEIRFARFRRVPRIFVPDQRRLVQWIRDRGPGPAWFCDLKHGCDVLNAGGLSADHIIDSREFPWVPGEHFVDRWIRLACLTPPAFAGRVPEATAQVARVATIEVGDERRAALGPWLAARRLGERPMLTIQMGSRRTLRPWMPRKRKSSDKFWPEDHWIETVRALRDRHPGYDILLLGTMKEFELNANVARGAGIRDLHNVADDLPIPILLPLLERAAGMISVDTGPAHAAASLGCPTVALFGDADPDLYRPGGPHTPAVVLMGRNDEGRLDITAISVASVMAAWESLARSPRAA